MKEADNLRNRIDVLNQIQPYVGTYFSKAYVRKKILRMSDEDIEQIEMENEEDPPPPAPGSPEALQAAELSSEVK